MFKINVLSEPKRNDSEGETCKGGILEETQDFRFVPRLWQQRVIGSLRDTAHALDEYRKYKDRGEHAEQHAHRGYHAKFIETAEVGRQKCKECCNGGKACKHKRLKHFALSSFQDFFEGGVRAH